MKKSTNKKDLHIKVITKINIKTIKHQIKVSKTTLLKLVANLNFIRF